MSGKRLTKAAWEGIEALFRQGVYTLRDIAAEYGVSEKAIRLRAKQYGWERDLSDKIRRGTKARRQRQRAEGLEPSHTRATEQEIIEGSVRVLADIQTRQEKMIARQMALVDQIMSDLEKVAATKTESGEKSPLIKPLNIVSQTTERLIGLQRKVLGMDIDPAAGEQADLVPLEERLKAYQQEEVIDASPNVQRINARGH